MNLNTRDANVLGLFLTLKFEGRTVPACIIGGTFWCYYISFHKMHFNNISNV